MGCFCDEQTIGNRPDKTYSDDPTSDKCNTSNQQIHLRIESMNKSDKDVSDGILINEKTIKNFINFLDNKNLNAFEKSNVKEESNENKKNRKEPSEEYNFEYFFDYNKCKTFISSNNKKGSGFIIVDESYFKKNNLYNKFDINKKVKIDKKSNKIIFASTGVLKEKKEEINNKENNIINDNDNTQYISQIQEYNNQNHNKNYGLFIYGSYRKDNIDEKINDYQKVSNIEKADSKEKNSSLINIKGSDGNFIEASENEKKLNDKISYINKQTEDVNVLNNNINNNTKIENNESNNITIETHFSNESHEINNTDAFSFNKAIINCLIRINCLIQHFQSNKLSYLQIQENDEKKKLLWAFTQILKDENIKSDFDCFKSVLGEKNNIFVDSLDNNKKSLFLLQEMHDELNEKDKTNITEEFDSDQSVPEIELYKCITDFECHNKSFISQNFYFCEAIISKCNKCNKSLYNFSMNSILSFNLDKIKLYKESKKEPFNSLDISDCFDFYTREQKYVGESKNICEKCNEEYKMYNKISSCLLPEIFIIYLEKEKNNKSAISLKIKCEFDNLDKYIFIFNNINKQQLPSYELIGIVIEKEEKEEKEKEEKNNFMSYSKKNKKWYLSNNSKFEEFSDIVENIKEVPSLLIYQKIKE